MSIPTIVAVAGWGQPARALVPLAGAIGQHAAVIPTSIAELQAKPTGPGQKGPQPGCSAYARALARIAGDFSPAPAILGWSTGAIVALETARHFPNVVGGLVLVGGFARFCADDDYPHGVPASALRTMALTLKRSPEPALEDFFGRVFAPATETADVIADEIKNALALGMPTLLDGLDYLREADLREALPAVSVPCLVLHGRDDAVVPVDAAKYLSARLRQSRLHTFKEQGHALPTVAPELIAPDIIRFLGDLA